MLSKTLVKRLEPFLQYAGKLFVIDVVIISPLLHRTALEN